MTLHSLYYRLLPQKGMITSRAHGVDISKYDISFNPNLATAQLDFVIQRISYGLTRDQAYLALLPGVKQVPIRLGYHYLSSWYDYKTQADTFLRYVEGTEYHAFACDFEGAYNTLSVAFAKIAWDWMNYVEQKTGKEVILYTGKYLYQDYLTPSQSKYGINWNTKQLWTAQYPLIPNPDGFPSLPSGRLGWAFWQYSSKGDGTKYGAGRSTACDLNVYNGTLEQLKTWLKVIPEIPNGETMSTAISTTHNLSLRPLHQVVNSSTILQVPMNTRLAVLDGWKAPVTTELNNEDDKWVQVTYNGKTGWIGLVHLSITYGTTDFIFPDTTPQDKVPDYLTAHFEDGTTQKYIPE